jgi:hypothetical protein
MMEMHTTEDNGEEKLFESTVYSQGEPNQDAKCMSQLADSG